MRTVAAPQAALLTLLLLAACGNLAVPGLSATAAGVALQSGDLPSGLIKCSDSGDVNTYLNAVKAKDPSTYKQANDEWNKEKAAGATGAQIEIYADSAAYCHNLLSGGAQNAPGGSNQAPPKIVVNYVVQYKDSATAAKQYGSQVFGFKPSDLKQQGGNITEGTATGLGANSSVGSVSVFGINIYVAVWQKAAFVTALVALDIPTADAQKAINNINGRIH